MPAKQWMLKSNVKPLPTIASIETHLASGNLAAAAVAARSLNEKNPSPQNVAILQRVVVAQANSAIDRKHGADFHQAMAAADKLAPNQPAWAIERAMLLARWGHLPQALMLLPADADEATRQRALNHAADRAIRFKSYTGLPDEHRDGCKTIILAFAKYERGEEDACRESLQSIGLQSPFLEWKLLLRGLMAFSANDDAKALENWQRLNAERLPARLMAPLRARIDAAYREAQPPTRAGKLHAQARQLMGSKGQADLIELQKIIGQPKHLAQGWKLIASALASLKPSQPDLADQLAHCVYHAIIRQGDPNDLVSYRRTFGAPPDDPEFHRLQAMVLEAQEQVVSAIGYWEKYERWLGTKPAAWDIALIPRARSLILERLGTLCQAESNRQEDAPDLYEAFEKMFGEPKREKLKKTPGDYFRAAIAADPTAISPRLTFIRTLAEKEPTAEGVELAKEALVLEPGNLEVLEILAGSLQRLKRPAEALAYRKQALAANPLDVKLTTLAALCCLASARRAMIDGQFEEAEQILASHAELLAAANGEFGADLLRVTFHRKAGCRDEANALRDRLLQTNHARLAAVFVFSVDAALAKLKPADKTAANKLLTESLKAPATIPELLLLHAAYASHELNGIEYRGQKTFPKKIENLIDACSKQEMTSEECDHLLQALLTLQNGKFIAKICERLVLRFPKNPRLRLVMAKSLLEGRPSWRAMQRIRSLLEAAKQLALQAGENREMLDEIEEMLSHIPDPFDDLPFSFGR